MNANMRERIENAVGLISFGVIAALWILAETASR